MNVPPLFSARAVSAVEDREGFLIVEKPARQFLRMADTDVEHLGHLRRGRLALVNRKGEQLVVRNQVVTNRGQKAGLA